MLNQGRGTWPDVQVDERTFVAYLAARAKPAEIGNLHASDLYLACACAEGIEHALARFDERYLSGAGRVLAKVGASASLADEVKQRLRVTLFVRSADNRARIEDYSGRGT